MEHALHFEIGYASQDFFPSLGLELVVLRACELVVYKQLSALGLLSRVSPEESQQSGLAWMHMTRPK